LRLSSFLDHEGFIGSANVSQPRPLIPSALYVSNTPPPAFTTTCRTLPKRSSTVPKYSGSLVATSPAV
jgi:hypothetical protein